MADISGKKKTKTQNLDRDLWNEMKTLLLGKYKILNYYQNTNKAKESLLQKD